MCVLRGFTFRPLIKLWTTETLINYYLQSGCPLILLSYFANITSANLRCCDCPEEGSGGELTFQLPAVAIPAVEVHGT